MYTAGARVLGSILSTAEEKTLKITKNVGKLNSTNNKR